MYRNILQWRQIRRKILEEGVSQREMSRRTGISRETISKIVKNDVPPERVKRLFPYSKNDVFSREILDTVEQLLDENNGCKISVKSVLDRLRSDAGYPYSYNGLREYIVKKSIRLGSDALVDSRKSVRLPADDWRLTHSVLASCNEKSGVTYLKAIALPPFKDLQAEKVQKYAVVLREKVLKKEPQRSTQIVQEAATNWISSVVMRRTTAKAIASSLDDAADVEQLVEIARSNNRIKRCKALAILLSRRGVSGRSASKSIGICRESFSK